MMRKRKPGIGLIRQNLIDFITGLAHTWYYFRGDFPMTKFIGKVLRDSGIVRLLVVSKDGVFIYPERKEDAGSK